MTERVTVYVTADGDLNRRFGAVIDVRAGAEVRELVAEALRATVSYVERGHADRDLLGEGE